MTSRPGRRRPAVLHTIPKWGVPSERFVVDLIRSTTLTRPFVACGAIESQPSTGDVDVPVSTITPLIWRVPQRWRKSARAALIAAVGARRRAQVLHAHFGYWGIETSIAARLMRLPWVLSLHGYDVLVIAAREGVPERAKRAGVIVVPSQFLARAAVAQGYPEDRIRVIPSGLDVSAYTHRVRHARPDGSVHVAFVGRFVPKKGALDAAGAMAIARQQLRSELVCTFVGYGPQEQALRDEITRLRLPATIVDGRAPTAVRSALDNADVLLTASRTSADGDAESLGLVNLEAQLSGLPVVSTRHGAIPEAVAPDGAVLVPESDVPALGEALADVARHPERWAAMGSAGRAHVLRHYQLADRAREVDECYVALTAAARKSVGARPH
ncbi:MAG: glycosyltransferase [Actinomycetes bacterium]